MSVSYDKKTRESAAKKDRNLATLEIAGLTFQGGVTLEEQSEILDLFQKLNKRQVAEASDEARAAALSSV